MSAEKKIYDEFDELSALIADGDGEKTSDENSIGEISVIHQCKFLAPVSQSCNICGELISSTRDWLLHHMSDKHKKVIRCLNLFRSKCIEHRNDDDDASPSLVNKSLAERLRTKVNFTQELFEVHSTSNLICGVCGAGVFDAENHLSSTKHNEAYMNLLYVDDLVTIKEKCIKSTGVDWREYEASLVQQLERHQPRTDESPLEVYVLKSDEQFKEWMWKFMIALSNYAQPQEFTLSYCNSLELLLPSVVLKEKTIDQSAFWQNDCCSICRSKHFSRDSFKKHINSEAHLKKVKIFDFLRFAEKFQLVSGLCAEQIRIESSDEPCLGVESVTEFVDNYDQNRFWICAVCFHVNEEISEIVSHVTSAKHLMNCLDIYYPGIKLTAKTGREMNDEVKRFAREIQVNRATGKIRVAELVDTTVEHIFQSLGYVRKPEVDLTSDSTSMLNDSHVQLSEGESDPQILFSDRNEEMLWCDTCWVMIQVKKNDTGTKTVWARHVSTKSHQDKKEIRKEFIFEKKNFVEEKVAANIREALTKKDLAFLGLEDVIERKIKNKAGSPIHDCICLLCAEKFHVAQFTAHVTGQPHVLQFLHKNERNLMRKILNENQSTARKKLVDDFVSKKKTVRENVRVYNPTRAELLVVEYERLKLQIAEKERILEQKRKDKEREVIEKQRKEELERALEAEEDRKRVEVQRIAELQRRERERQVEEERRHVEQQKALLQIEKVKEQQQIEARKKMDQQRLLDMMQREQQRQKEDEKKKLGQQRILELMQKEKAKMDEDDVKKLENDEKKREENEKRRQKEKLIAAAISISKTLPAVPQNVIQTTKTSPTINNEPKWVPLAQNEAPQRTVISPTKATADTRTVLVPSAEKAEPPDVLIGLLEKSQMIPIPYPETAYAQPILNNTNEPLIGLQHIYEFECLDNNYEPGYFCRLCLTRMAAKDLLSHVTSTEHKLKYFEHSYRPYHQNVITNYPNPGTRSVVLKQYTQQVERQEGGRKRIEFRLMLKVSNIVLSSRKPSLFLTPDNAYSSQLPPSAVQYLGSASTSTYSVPPPSIGVPPPIPAYPLPATHAKQTPVAMDVCPPGISPPLPNMIQSTDYSPVVFPPPPKAVVESSSKSKRRSRSREKTTSKNYHDATWDDKCSKFLQKLTKQDKTVSSSSTSKDMKHNDSKSSSSTRKSRSPSRVSEKKNDSRLSARYSEQKSTRKRSLSPLVRINDNKTKSSDEKRKSLDEKKKFIGGDEVLLSGPVMETKHRETAKRQRSRSPRSKSPKRQKRRSKTPPSREHSKQKTSQPLPSKSFKHVEKVDMSKYKTNTLAHVTIAETSLAPVSVLSADDISILQQLADTNPQALEKLVLENPSILAALLDHNKAIDAAPTLVAVPAPPLKPVPPLEPNKPSFDMLVSSLLGSQQDNVNIGTQSQDTFAILLKMYADESNKQQKQAEQQRMLLELLQQVGAPTDQNNASKQVYDYSHGRSSEESGKTFEIEDLIQEASANVQQAQKVGSKKKPPESPSSKQQQQTTDQWKKLASDNREKSRPLLHQDPPKSPRSKQSSSFQMPSMKGYAETSNFDKQQHENAKDAERRRKKLMDNLANELLSSSSNHPSVGRSSNNIQHSNPFLDLDKILNLAKVQTSIPPGTSGFFGRMNPTPQSILGQAGLLGQAPVVGNVQNPLAFLGLLPGGQGQGQGMNQQSLAQLASLFGSSSGAVPGLNFGLGPFGNFR